MVIARLLVQTRGGGDAGSCTVRAGGTDDGGDSRLQTNLVLWYERNGLQVRLAHNHRSKRADQNNYQGWQGLTLYQAATNYVDASVSYDVNSKFSVYGQVSNLTNEYDRYYVTWADQKAFNNVYERKYVIGVRAKF